MAPCRPGRIPPTGPRQRWHAKSHNSGPGASICEWTFVGGRGSKISLEGVGTNGLQSKEFTLMLAKSLVKVVARDQSPPSLKYAGRTGYVTATASDVYETTILVLLDGNAEDVDTAFEERDLVPLRQPDNR